MDLPFGHAFRRVTAAFWAVLFVVFFAYGAAAQEAKPLKGVALIIGQSQYTHITPLANPDNDARAVDGLLTSLGFDTRTVTDRDTAKLKRDLERFVEDAEGADVALLYYSGHGIEAGGENYLVPTDADLVALDDAGEKLVPLSAIMERIKRNVPVTILLLDACRTNPFPATATLKAGRDDRPAPIATIGLGAPRGMSVVEDQAARENLGMVIGLAAEPGRAALDGEPGQNSPYAAALIRHLSAIKGEEFGTVMRMITEEVYLSTKTRQRPWINESLRRLLYFGGSPQEASGNSGLITKERRQLLLTITTLPSAERKQVETIAAKDGVPLDVLYGVLHSLGIADIPKDPEELEKLLRAQAEGVKRMIAERDALKADNPEITALAEAAQDALQQGAIATARQFLDQAVKIVEQGRAAVEVAEARIKERRLADAQVYFWRGETASLAADYMAAARDYESAYALAAKWDDDTALYYKLRLGDVLMNAAKHRSDRAIIEEAIRSYQSASTLIGRNTVPRDRSAVLNNLGNAFATLAERDTGSENLQKALLAYGAAVDVFPRATYPTEWGMTQNNIGSVLYTLGERDAGTAILEASAGAYRNALETVPRATSPFEWAAAQNNLGNVLRLIGERLGDTAHLEEAIAAYHAALEVRTRDQMPLQWGVTQSNLGLVLRLMGERESGTETLKTSIATYRLALEELKPDLAPLDWAMAQSNLGTALATIGQRENDLDRLREAVAAYRAALTRRSREAAPYLWGMTQNNLGSAFALIGERTGSAQDFAEAAKAFRLALEERTREKVPYQWATTQSNLGAVLQSLGEQSNDTDILIEAVAAHRAALLELTRERVPLQWSKVQNNLGNALRSLGERQKGTGTLREALAALKASLEERSREQSPYQWARTQVNVGLTSLALAQRGAGRKVAQEAIQAFEAALDVYKDAHATQNITQVESFLAEARALKR